MADRDKEYLMLREEILHLSDIISQTTNFFYAFIAAYVAAMTAFLKDAPDKSDTIYVIFMYIVILPAYLIVLNKAQAMYKIGGYLYVYHEQAGNAAFKWETYNREFSNYCAAEKPSAFHWVQSHMRAYHFPFSLVNITTVLLFAAGTYQNRQNIFSLYEGIKIAIFLLLSSTMFILIREQRKITTNDYIFKWKRLK
ncbi:MAG: hypothetical protein HFF20_09840 [Oscillospiraceae bacterium]|nr:hypothetical protein [Oscillospiraceae bacterium]MCI9549501.1 hypothetical protein [Oscillospiraceae bacterium]